MRPRNAFALALVGGGALLVGRARRRAARRARTAWMDALPPSEIVPSEDPDDVLGVLRADHDELRSMTADLRARHDDGPDGRRSRVTDTQRLVIRATQHEAAESTEVWPVIRERVEEGELLATEAAAQELELRRILHTLDRRAPESPDYDDLLARWEAAAAEHMSFEETRVWPWLSRALDDRERAELGEAVRRATRHTPTRPHPSEPATPGRHGSLDKALALLDRVEDRITNRGRS